MSLRERAGAVFLVVCLGACTGGRSGLPIEASSGPQPVLPQPDYQRIPTLEVPRAEGWRDGEQPVAAADLRVSAFARDLVHPRWLYVLPNGDVLVAETNAPEKPTRGLRDWLTKRMKQRGGSGVASPNRIRLLRDTDGDGQADLRVVFADGLRSPFGMALIGESFYVANTDALIRFPYRRGDTRVSDPVLVSELPAGPNNRHWTRSLVANPEGSRLYVGVGSDSNVGENGLEQERLRAAILEIHPGTAVVRLVAGGLRNPVGMDWHPRTGALWVAVNERDEMGNDLVPDYLTAVVDGGFYGWPFSYYGQHVDARVEPRAELISRAIVPDYALGAHTASLGLAFSRQGALPDRLSEGAFVAQHGSWNRDPPSGYKVVFVRFVDGMPTGKPEDVLTGFLAEDGHARGRPVGVALDASGALLVADDAGHTVWRVERVDGNPPARR